MQQSNIPNNTNQTANQESLAQNTAQNTSPQSAMPTQLFKDFLNAAQQSPQNTEQNTQTQQVLIEASLAQSTTTETQSATEQTQEKESGESKKSSDIKKQSTSQPIPLEAFESTLNATTHSAPQLQALINYITQKTTEFQSKSPAKKHETFPPFKVPNIGLVHISVEKTEKGLLVYLKLPDAFSNPQVYDELRKRLKEKYNVEDIIEGEKLEIPD